MESNGVPRRFVFTLQYLVLTKHFEKHRTMRQDTGKSLYNAVYIQPASLISSDCHSHTGWYESLDPPNECPSDILYITLWNSHILGVQYVYIHRK